MYINRRTFVVKRGRLQDLIDLFMSVPTDRPVRMLGPNGIAPTPFDEIVIEFSFDSLAEYESYWAELLGSDDMGAVQAQVNEMTETGGRSELHYVIHQA